MAITQKVALEILSKKLVSFKSRESGEGVEYTEVLAVHDGDLVVLRAQDGSKFDDLIPGAVVEVNASDDGPANLRVRKYRAHD